MSETITVVRHTESFFNHPYFWWDGTREYKKPDSVMPGTAAPMYFHHAGYRHRGAGLTSKGDMQADRLSSTLTKKRHIDLDTPVASSTRDGAGRAYETARRAGFTDITQYARLDEVQHDLTNEEILAMLREGRIPDLAVSHAVELLDNPPCEDVWFTCGLVMVGLAKVTGVEIPNNRNFPDYGAIMEIPLS